MLHLTSLLYSNSKRCMYDYVLVAEEEARQFSSNMPRHSDSKRYMYNLFCLSKKMLERPDLWLLKEMLECCGI